MRLVLSIILLAPALAQAHPSLLPHDHAHGSAMLPDIGTLVVGVIFLFAAGLTAYARVRKE